MSKKHYVEFRSPGTFFFEESTRPIESWDARKAVQMSREVVEQYGARPFCFRFLTRLEAPPVVVDGERLNVEPKTIDSSGWHFIGGEVLTYEQVEDTERNSILRGNMRGNGWPLVVQHSGGRMQELEPDDVVVNADSGAITRRASDKDLARYRAEKLAEWGRE